MTTQGSMQESEAAFDTETDIVVVGAGAGGMSAAIVAATEKQHVIVVEKTALVGGSAAYSAGVCWVPDNHLMPGVGMPDSLEAGRTYLKDLIGAQMDSRMVEKYLATGPEAFRYFEANSEVKFAARSYTPDYLSSRPGAMNGGRAIAPLEFDGRKLGRHFDEVRPPIPEFTVLGGMMVNAVDAERLLGATRSFTSFKHAVKLVLRHASDRLRYSRGTRLVMGNALAARLYKSVLDKKVPVWLNCPISRFIRDSSGRVIGVVVQKNGHPHRIKARKGVILATGGFPHDAELRGQRLGAGASNFSAAPSSSTGDGMRHAVAEGAVMGPKQKTGAFWSPASRWPRADGSVSNFPHLVMDRSKPGIIAVNRSGKRFVNESENYHDFGRALLEQSAPEGSARGYLICDSRFLKRYTLGLAHPAAGGIAPKVRSGYLLTGTTIGELAGRIDVDAEALAATISCYNRHAEKGEDPEFGKGSTEYNRYLGDPNHKPNACLAPIQEGPFYALPMYVGDIGTCEGLATDELARVLDANGNPIPGLLACGNDMHSIFGGEYPGAGITLGPALTFGYVAAKHLAAQ